MKKALVFLLLSGVGVGLFLLWRRSQQQVAPADDLWAPVETWPATIADRWPTTPAPVVDEEEPPVSSASVGGSAAVSPEAAEETPTPKRAPRKRAGS
jgi:hypothetical protein